MTDTHDLLIPDPPTIDLSLALPAAHQRRLDADMAKALKMNKPRRTPRKRPTATKEPTG